MKTLQIIALTLFCLVAQAQEDRYQAIMKKLVAQVDTARIEQTYITLTNAFDRVATAEKSKWLPYYYASYCASKVAFLEKNKNFIDEKANKADAYADKADSLSPNNSDVLALKASIGYARIAVDFMSRGPKYGISGTEFLVKAIKSNPNNPRPYLLLAQTKFNMPEGFGGDKKEGCRLISQAETLFKNSPKDTIEPHWGEDQVAWWSKKCEEMRQRQAAAAAGK